MTEIQKEAKQIIDYIYKHNPGMMVEVLLSAMVQEGVRKGLEMALCILHSHTEIEHWKGVLPVQDELKRILEEK